MSTQQQRQLRNRGNRYPLLIHRRLNEVVFWPSILLIVACAALLIWNPVAFEPFRIHLSIILVGTTLILILTFALRLTAYVQCHENGLCIQLPLFRLTLPYHEIRNTRPTEMFRIFSPRKQPHIRRHFLEGLLGKTVLVMEMDELPRPKPWLRLWMSPYMICPDPTGFVILVPDWIDFRTEFDDFRTRAKHRRYSTIS